MTSYALIDIMFVVGMAVLCLGMFNQLDVSRRRAYALLVAAFAAPVAYAAYIRPELMGGVP